MPKSSAGDEDSEPTGPIPLEEARRQQRAKAKAAERRDNPGFATTGRKAIEPEFLARRYGLDDAGLWRIGDKGTSDFWVSGPFEVLARTRNLDGEDWGVLLTWRDREDREHELALPDTLLVGDGQEARARLGYGGLRLSSHPGSRAALIEFLTAIEPGQLARCVPTIGWHTIAGSRVFVLPKRVFGACDERVVFQPAARLPDRFGSLGSVEDWRAGVAALCPGNPRLIFAVATAFAGPLMELLAEASGGINFIGSSRLGKSTALTIAASVWGGDARDGAAAFVRQWRTTDNALEATAAMHNGTLLILDELGQYDPRKLGETAYALANGRGKERLERNATLRASVQYRLLFLSSSEASIADMIAETGQRVRAGMEVRLVDIPADEGAGHGIFGRLHGEPDGAAFAHRLALGVRGAFGTAGTAFLDYLAAQMAAAGDAFTAQLAADRDTIYRRWAALHPGADGQVLSVARRFALVALAGEVAGKSGITGWEPGLALDAAQVLLQAWLEQRGGVGRREDQQAVTQLRAFISRFLDARFANWPDPSNVPRTGTPSPDDAGAADASASSPIEPSAELLTRRGPPIANFAGWRRRRADATGELRLYFYLTAEAMREAMAGLSLRDANRALVDAAYLKPGNDGKPSAAVNVPGFHVRQRLYVVSGDILGDSI